MRVGEDFAFVCVHEVARSVCVYVCMYVCVYVCLRARAGERDAPLPSRLVAFLVELAKSCVYFCLKLGESFCCWRQDSLTGEHQ